MTDNMLALTRQVADLRRRVEQLETNEPLVVAAVYTTDAGQSIPHASWTVVNYEDKVIDTHNAVTVGSGWKFTAPIAGLYVVNACLMFTLSTAWAETEFIQLAAYRASTHYRLLSRPAGADFSGSAQYLTANGMALVDLTASQELSIRVNQQCGSALAIHNSTTYNHVSIFRL